MQFSDALCYALMITITSTCVDGSYTKQGLETKSDREKRESSVIIDSYPSTTFAAKPDVIFDRVSKPKFNSKPKHGRPRPQYGRSPHTQRARPMKKYRKKLVRGHKFKKYRSTSNSHLNKHPIIHTKAPKKGSKKPESGYGPPKMWNEYNPFYLSEPASFAEPPKYVSQDYERNPQKTHGEPPVDSYGVPLTHPDLQVTAQSHETSMNYPSVQTVEPFAETPNNDGLFSQQQQKYQSYQSYQQDVNVDNVSSYSKHHPVNHHNEREVHEGNAAPDHETLHSYADVYKQSLLSDFNLNPGSQKKKHYHNVIKNRPWKSAWKIKPESSKDNPQKHIMVGGQYAEPPGHLVPDFQPSLPDKIPGASYFDLIYRYPDSEFAASASISPYVNYKNSNMAFSPQNLNDAFSL